MQVIDTLGSYGILQEGIFRVSNVWAYSFCTFGLFYYILSISFFFKCLGPWMRRRWGTAKALRFWEYFVSVSWQIQTLGFWVLTITPPVLESELSIVPTWVTTSVGVVLVVLGIGSKMGAIYGTGYNTYYWYDMVTEIPNAYFCGGWYLQVSRISYIYTGKGDKFWSSLALPLCANVHCWVSGLGAHQPLQHVPGTAFCSENVYKTSTEQALQKL